MQILPKTSVDEVLCMILRKRRQLPGPHRGAAPKPCSATFVLQTLTAHPWKKNPAGAHATRSGE